MWAITPLLFLLLQLIKPKVAAWRHFVNEELAVLADELR